jgi:hypothetical protein
MGRRVGAWIVDGVIVLAPAVGLFTSDLEYLEEDDLDQSGSDFCDDYMDQENGVCVDVGDRVYFSDGVPVAPWLVVLGIGLLIPVLLQGLKGWTPGKLLFGLRTVGEDGQPPGIGRAIIRWVLFIVDGLCAGLVGFIVALTNKGHRRVGDMAAKTYVVGKEYAGSPIVVPGVTPSYAAGGYPGYPGHPGAPGGPAAPGTPGAGWGPPPPGGPVSTEHAPTWGPPPTWGAPPAESPPAAEPETPPPAGAEPAEPPSSPEPEPAEPEPQPLVGGFPAAEAEPSEPPPAAEDVAPTEEPRPSEVESTTAGTGDSTQPGYNPQWDPARGTYIVWSPERGQWLGWDDAAKEWRPL